MPDAVRRYRTVVSAYRQRVAAVAALYLRSVGDPGIESPLHFFICWMVYFAAYAMPLILLVSLIVAVT